MLLRIDQYKPLILAARDQIRKGLLSAADLLRLCSMMAVRTTITHRNTADVRAYQAGVRAVKDGASSAQQVFESMRALYPADDEFKAAFSNIALDTGGPRKRLIKFLLCGIEATYGGAAPDFETDPASIEHVLPENPSVERDRVFDEESRERFTYRLGNLTLLEPPLKRQAGNQPYEQKKGTYARSSYAMTRTIVAGEWTPTAIDARQRDLAARAVQRFRLDY